MNWSFRNHNALFNTRALDLGALTLLPFFLFWLVVKCFEPQIKNGPVFDVGYVILSLGVFCFSSVPSRVVGRMALPFLCIAAAMAEPAILLGGAAVQRIIGVPSATFSSAFIFGLEWFGAGCVLMLLVFGLRAGLVAIAVSIAAMLFAVASALAIHSLALHAPNRTYQTVTASFDLAIAAAAQAALWPMAVVITGWAMSTGAPIPAIEQHRPRKRLGDRALDAIFYLAAVYVHVIQRSLNVSARARRKEYWLFQLANALVVIVLFAIGAALFGRTAPRAYALPALYLVLIAVPLIAVTVRRLHDSGKGAWTLLVLLVPALGWFALLAWMLTDSQPRTNAWGPSLKA